MSTEAILYKYMSAGTAEVVLNNGTLRWSGPSQFNDPNDMQMPQHARYDPDAVRTLALDLLWQSFYEGAALTSDNWFGRILTDYRDKFPKLSRKQFVTEFSPAVDESLKSLPDIIRRFNDDVLALAKTNKVLCLTRNPINELMWAHYADQHRGLVLGFESIEGLDSPWNEARPVRYVDQPPSAFTDSGLASVLAGQMSLDSKQLMDDLVYVKSRRWEYEDELRIFSGAGRDESAEFEDLKFHPLELTKVIFGLRSPPEFVEKVRGVIHKQYSNARAFQVLRSNAGFEFELRSLES